MVEATERLLRRDGYAATGWRTVVEEAGAPWGSAYHHFPGGKEQLASEAVALGSAHVESALDKALSEAETVPDGVRRWFAMAARNLERSEFVDGCPVATVALETAPRSERLSQACAEGVRSWKSRLGDEISRGGVAPERARQLATLIVSNLEGALLLARVERSAEPMDLAGDLMRGLLWTEMEQAQGIFGDAV